MKNFNLREPYRTYGVVAAMMLSFYAVWFAPLVAHADYTITTGSGVQGVADVTGGTGTGQEGGVLFTTTGAGTTVGGTYCLYKEGSPVDNTFIDIYATASNLPTGSSLGHSDAIPTSALGAGSGGASLQTYTFASPVTLDAATQYALVVSMSGTRDTTNHPVVCGYVDANPWFDVKNNSGTWVDRGYGSDHTTIAVVEGGGGGGGGATSTAATSTPVNDPNRDLFNGFLLFFMSFFGMVWLFRRRV